MVQRESSKSQLVRSGSPVRTCVGCRERALAVELLRVVARAAVDGYAVVPDPQRRLAGRGAWLHPDPGCLNRAIRRRAFGAALRVSGHLDISAVAQMLEAPRDSGVNTAGESYTSKR
ncbi:YlxR family protein [Skermania sp. ID1734]|uniref:YlxR family protein n=1 Tax=Skermania sp. ID1734 TaxID=2597516 RepID=UPI0011800F45|nr:YlxR family protein [Skermania sp. ID1734]TSD96107.1 YlxR family protein [Skermania sp. ID1734]